MSGMFAETPGDLELSACLAVCCQSAWLLCTHNMGHSRLSHFNVEIPHGQCMFRDVAGYAATGGSELHLSCFSQRLLIYLIAAGLFICCCGCCCCKSTAVCTLHRTLPLSFKELMPMLAVSACLVFRIAASRIAAALRVHAAECGAEYCGAALLAGLVSA